MSLGAKLTLSRPQAFLILCLVAVMWGSTGIWSKISSLSSAQIVTGRTTFAAIVLFAVVVGKGRLFRLENWRNPTWLIFCAVALGLHWFCFFDCMRRGSVTLGLVTYATCPLFTAIAEPLLKREKISLIPIFCSLLALVGIWMVSPIYSLSIFDLIPTLIGVASGLLMTVVALISRYKLVGLDSYFLSWALNSFIAAVMWFIAPLTPEVALQFNNLLALFGLGVLCSAAGQSLFILCMRYLDSRIATLISTLEAPSGVFLAWMILGEPVTLFSLLGCLLVLLSVFVVLRRSVV